MAGKLQRTESHQIIFDEEWADIWRPLQPLRSGADQSKLRQRIEDLISWHVPTLAYEAKNQISAGRARTLIRDLQFAASKIVSTLTMKGANLGNPLLTRDPPTEIAELLESADPNWDRQQVVDHLLEMMQLSRVLERRLNSMPAQRRGLVTERRLQQRIASAARVIFLEGTGRTPKSTEFGRFHEFCEALWVPARRVSALLPYAPNIRNTKARSSMSRAVRDATRISNNQVRDKVARKYGKHRP